MLKKIQVLLDRSLMIGWRKIWKILKPWKGVLCIHFRVCLSVCVRSTEHTFWPRNLIFGLKDPWDMRKKRNFLFFEILKNVIFRAIFTQKVCLRATEHNFWPRNLIFGLKDSWDMRKKCIFFVFRNFEKWHF